MTFPARNLGESVRVPEEEIDWIPARGDFFRRGRVWLRKNELFRSATVIRDDYERGAKVLLYHRMTHQFEEAHVG